MPQMHVAEAFLKKEWKTAMKNVLCLGDSNTWGFTPGTCKRYDEHTRWTGVLQDELGEGWRIHENGQSGRTTVFESPTRHFMTGIGALPYALDTLRPLDAIVIMLGTNDLHDHSTAASVDGLGHIVRSIQTFNQLYPGSEPVFRDGKEHILVLTPIEIGENVWEGDSLHGKTEESRKFPEHIKGLCEWLQVDWLNIQPIAKPSEIDGIHMMPQEHRKLALAVKEKLLSMMEEKE